MKSNSIKKNPREKSKTRAWEKQRRDRLSECFDKLRLALPNYDASKKLSKIDILIVATSTIKDLDGKLKHLLVGNGNENAKSEELKLKVSAGVIKKLEDRVKKLLVRNEELANLLKNAGIRVPSAFGSVKKFRKVYKHSDKITPSQAKIIQKELEKENQVKPPKPPKPKAAKRNADKKVSVNSRTKSHKRQSTNLVSSSNCIFIVSQPRIINNSCYIVSKNPRKTNQTTAGILTRFKRKKSSEHTSDLTVVSNSFLVRTPIVSSNIKPSVLSTNAALSNLGPGTLVFANGTVMPIVPTAPALPVLPTIFTSPVQTKLPAIIVVSCNTKTAVTNKISASSDTKSTEKNSAGCSMTRPLIKPKTCITRTTQINKVPIPALSSKYNSHSCLGRLKNQGAGKKVTLTLSNLKSETKKTTENDLDNLLIKRKNAGESLQVPKKHKSNLVENKTNSDNSSLTLSSTLNDQSVNSKNTKVTSSSSEPAECISRVSENAEVEGKQENNKVVQEPNDGIKMSVFSFEKETPTSCNELPGNPNITVKSLGDQTSSPNKASHTDQVFYTSSNTVYNQSEIAKSHTSQEATRVVENEKNTLNVPTKNVEVKICNQAETVSEPAIPSAITTSVSSCVTAACNKQEMKTFEINKSQSEPVTKNSATNELKSLELNLPQSELSNDIFASFQVNSGCPNAGSTSPTAAFLLAFPLVSSGIKVTEVIVDENSESHAVTPNLLQIGTMDITKPSQSYSDSLTPNILNFENFSFFSNKDNCGGFYNNCSMVSPSCQTSTVSVTTSSKMTSSLEKNVLVTSQHIIDSESRNIHSKVNTSDNISFLSSNKIESSSKISNLSNYKTNITEKVLTNMKSASANIHQEPLHSSRNLEIQPYISTDYSLNRGSDLGNLTTNILDINTNPFSSKIMQNENYRNKNKSTLSGQALITKSSDSSINYHPNYRDCASFATNSVVFNKNYNSVYTSAANNDYFYNPSASGGDFNSSNCNNYSNYRKTDNYNNYNAGSEVYHKEKFNQTTQPKVKPTLAQNKPINWMTGPSTSVSYKPDYFLPAFSKEHNFNTNLSTNSTFTLPPNTYFNTCSVYNANDNLNSASEIRKTVDLALPVYTYQKIESEENQFPWSPNKIPQFLDSTHSQTTFVPSTLPTLVGDLALNNTPIIEQKNTKDKNRVNSKKIGNCENQSGPTNFLSVSQLVEHNQENVAAKVISRRSSSNRSKTNTPKSKRVINRIDSSKDVPSYQKSDKINQHKQYDISVATNLFSDAKQQPRNKNVASSYSAEALIGNQLSSDSSAKRNINQNKSTTAVPNFFSENIVPYFPPVDVSQDNGYMQTNQSLHANTFSQNFTTFQNNTYGPNNFIPSACTLTSTYIPNNNFMHSSSNQEFLVETPNMFQNSSNVQTKDKNNYVKNYYRQTDKTEKNPTYSCKKAKKRSINESSLPSFDIPFLSMPGTINSPILPDDFHTTYLPPTTLYSCKNPLYSKCNSEMTPNTLIPPLPAISGSKSGIQHSEMSPSVNSAGTSLTNFNLSTIFPEINKIPVQDHFSDTRSKDYHPVSKSFSMSSSLQVPFNSKSSINFGTFGT